MGKKMNFDFKLQILSTLSTLANAIAKNTKRIEKIENESKKEEVLNNIAETISEFWDSDCVADHKEAFILILEQLQKVGIVKKISERTLTKEECRKLNEDQI